LLQSVRTGMIRYRREQLSKFDGFDQRKNAASTQQVG
jgi:hypothetical protein